MDNLTLSAASVISDAERTIRNAQATVKEVRLFPEYLAIVSDEAARDIMRDAIASGTVARKGGTLVTDVAGLSYDDYRFLACGQRSFENAGNARAVRAASIRIHDAMRAAGAEKDRAHRDGTADSGTQNGTNGTRVSRSTENQSKIFVLMTEYPENDLYSAQCAVLRFHEDRAARRAEDALANASKIVSALSQADIIALIAQLQAGLTPLPENAEGAE